MAYFGDPDTAETEIFIRTFDRFFDCLNVRSASEWTQKKKPDLKPYTSSDDERLKVIYYVVCVFVCVCMCMHVCVHILMEFMMFGHFLYKIPI